MPASRRTATLSVNRYRSLLASLLVLIVVYPLVRGPAIRVVLVAVFSAILFSAVWGVHVGRRRLLAGPTLALRAPPGQLDQHIRPQSSATVCNPDADARVSRAGAVDAPEGHRP